MTDAEIPQSETTNGTSDAELTHLGAERAVKVSVSMPADVVASVRKRVAPREFSRYVAEATRHRVRLEMLGELVDAYVAEHGPFSEEVERQVEQEWRDAFGK